MLTLFFHSAWPGSHNGAGKDSSFLNKVYNFASTSKRLMELNVWSAQGCFFSSTMSHMQIAKWLLAKKKWAPKKPTTIKSPICCATSQLVYNTCCQEKNSLIFKEITIWLSVGAPPNSRCWNWHDYHRIQFSLVYSIAVFTCKYFLLLETPSYSNWQILTMKGDVRSFRETHKVNKVRYLLQTYA